MLSSSPASAKSFVFYQYNTTSSPEFRATSLSKEIVIAENELTSNCNLFERNIVYLSPNQIKQLPLSVKTDERFIDFLRFGSLMVRREDLPANLSILEMVEQDFDSKQAFLLLQNLVKQNYAPAQRTLASCYHENSRGEADMVEAVRLIKESALQGFAPAQYILGLRYEKGEGVEQNLFEAVRFYKLAAEQGFALAQFDLGCCFAKSQGIRRDWGEAAKYFKLAADQGHMNAQFSIAIYFEQGKGVKKDLEEAAKYFKLAADQGHELALRRFTSLKKATFSPLPTLPVVSQVFTTPFASAPSPSPVPQSVVEFVNNALKQQEIDFEEKLRFMDAMHDLQMRELNEKYNDLLTYLKAPNRAGAHHEAMDVEVDIVLPQTAIPGNNVISADKKRNDQDNASQSKRSRPTDSGLETH